MAKVAIIGATGAVGREMMGDLASSHLDDLDVSLFASAKSAGKRLKWREQELTVEQYATDEIVGFDYALMSAGSGLSKDSAQDIADKGTWVIDNSSAWRLQEGIPLVVPEVNASVLRQHKGPKIIANPNCSTIQLVLPLKVLEDHYGLEMVQVATYQSVSGAGQQAIRELRMGSQEEVGEDFLQPFAAGRSTRAFNCIPAIDKLDERRHCFEEEKMVRETYKILGRDDFPMLATTVRVPVFRCHGEAVSVRLKRKLRREEMVAAFQESGFLQVDDENNYDAFPTPRSVQGTKDVWVSRIRLPLGVEESEWVQFWVIADNLKKGASTNAVQILEYMESGVV